jgi:uncharacterized protein (TIGR03790 family)
MKCWLAIILGLMRCALSSHAAIAPESVAVLYNAAIPESKQLAEFYQKARGIPADQLVGLELPATADLTREQYETLLLQPLRREFNAKSWWNRQRDRGGILLPVSNKIRVLVVMRGVPLRISASPRPPVAKDKPAPAIDPINGHDEAAVDSELAMFGAEDLPILGVLANKYYQSEHSFTTLDLPFLVLTARIDGVSYTTCERLITDALAAEKTGLWGKAYVDIANKIPEGDQWLEKVADANAQCGVPTVVDRFNDTLPSYYPMTDAALYFGWYDWNVSEPFLNPQFHFKRGAVAMHLHSFSAEQLTDASKNWSAALLERGAAVTVGNVYEPYLSLTHNFGIIEQRLLAGFSWVEACWMAMPVASWQGIVLGDPLYRPFVNLSGGGVKQPEDLEYRALRAAKLEWPNNPLEYAAQLEKAAERMKSGVLAESLGLDQIRLGKPVEASQAFLKALALYPKPVDQLRQNFHLIAIDRAANRKSLAIRGLREAQSRYGSLPEAQALNAWLDILDPPPPPAADPNKPPAIPKP